MNILLDAYYDENYGDDIFIETITGMFSSCKFYSFLEYYPQEVRDWAQQIPNLYLLPESDVFLQKNLFDAYICVGGDIFPDKGDYTKRKAYVQSVKQGNGKVAFLGFNLFHEYSEGTRCELVALMQDADIIAPRDERSAELLRQMLPAKEIRAMADLAFLSHWDKKEEQETKNAHILGISVRKPNYADENRLARYCQQLAGVINGYLEKDAKRIVKLFSLSGGTSPDENVVEMILSSVGEQTRVQHILYAGDIGKLKEEIRACDSMLCTRLHAMISCIAMHVPFIPIVYEVKMEHILQEIGYRGEVFSFDGLDGIEQAVVRISGEELLWDEAALAAYQKRSLPIIEQLKKDLYVHDETAKICKQDSSGPVSPEKEYAKEQADAVAQKNRELEEMAEEMEKLQGKIAECQELMNHYLKTIEECNQTNGEYFQLIENLNQQLAQFNQQIASLHEEKQELTAMVNRMRPYFTTNLGRKMNTVVCSAMARNSDAVKREWEQIQNYFRAEGSNTEG
ncbi:MAG: polysaccharide pyruvyl transferase family protein [Lachnospiraceae bacterium]|nr:polysaccharide pyruvyl transferase family protein [Lachnospiraceae bacterium]